VNDNAIRVSGRNDVTDRKRGISFRRDKIHGEE